MELPRNNFRRYLPDLSQPRFAIAKQRDAHEHARALQEEHNPPWLYDLTQAWEKLYSEQFKGVTNDGTIQEGLYEPKDEGVAIAGIVQAAQDLFATLSYDQKQQLQYPIAAKEWRAWSNPEFLLRSFGLRLDEISKPQARLILAILESSFSKEGYAKALGAMRMNHFLGEICQIPKIMNEYSYNFLLFGEPSKDSAWGWSMYGHHLCLNVFFKGCQMIVSPTFTGAEPNEIDEGEYRGTAILHREGELGLKLMQDLPANLQEEAQIYKNLHDPGMRQTGDLVHDRWNKDDQRHLCGAFRDNRIVPYEGVLVGKLNAEQQKLVLDIAEQFVIYLPEEPRRVRLKQIEAHFPETYFSWIGGYADEDPFYYRIQSPVVILEFDHHSGVYLTNTEPAKFHTHTIVRSPNGGDYGNAIRDANDRLE